jgi:hypothetical protein
MVGAGSVALVTRETSLDQKVPVATKNIIDKKVNREQVGDL